MDDDEKTVDDEDKAGTNEAGDDESAKEKGGDDESGDDDEGEDDGAPSEKRIDQLDEQIRAAAQRAEETIGQPGQTFTESGSQESEEEDDQTIAPPG